MSIQNLGTATQRPNESIAYTIDATANGSSPTANSTSIVDKDDPGTDLSGSNLSGTASVSGGTITTPLVTSLTDGTNYRVVVNYDTDGNTLEDYFEVQCSDEI